MDWIKKRMDNQSASLSPLPIVARTHPPAILPPEAVPSRFENDYINYFLFLNEHKKNLNMKVLNKRKKHYQVMNLMIVNLHRILAFLLV
jgi:hypothetical protein